MSTWTKFLGKCSFLLLVSQVGETCVKAQSNQSFTKFIQTKVLIRFKVRYGITLEISSFIHENTAIMSFLTILTILLAIFLKLRLITCLDQLQISLQLFPDTFSIFTYRTYLHQPIYGGNIHSLRRKFFFQNFKLLKID